MNYKSIYKFKKIKKKKRDLLFIGDVFSYILFNFENLKEKEKNNGS